MKIPPPSSRRQLGLTLVELMVALVLGLVVIGAVVNLFLTNRQTYRTTENLARMQENLRIAYELMARDVREAGATACGSININNIVNIFLNEVPVWNFHSETIKGYIAGTTPTFFAPSNVTTDSPILSITKGTSPANETSVVFHDPKNAVLTLSNLNSIKTGDILFICLGKDAAIFQASNVEHKTVKHESSSNITKGNRTSCLTAQTLQSSNNTCENSFQGATILPLQIIRWYVGVNNRGGTSLYRKVGNKGAMEMVPNIDQLTLNFLSNGDTAYQSITNVTDWTQVQAVRIVVRSVSTDKVGTDGQPLRREYPFTIALRNRLD